MKHSFKDWVVATRYWSFPVSAMPVVVTFAYLLSRGMVPSGSTPILCFILAVIGVVILHSAGNVLSDYFDHKTGVDSPEAYSVPNLVFKNFEPREYLLFAIGLFAVGIAIGFVLVALSGWQLLVIGGIGVALTAAYSWLKFHALGDLDIFVIFSILIMLGTGFVVCGHIVWEPLVLALPIGIITVAVLHANNTTDIESDGKVGMTSFAAVLGGTASVHLYRVYMVIPFIAIIVAVACGWVSPWALLCLVAALPAWQNIKAASHFAEKGIHTLDGLDQATAKLQLVFSGLLALGLFIAAILA